VFCLLAAIITSSVILIAFKLFGRLHIDIIVAITLNYLVASSLGFWLCSGESKILSATQQPWFLVSVLAGIMLITTFIIYATSTQKAGIAITSVSGKMSVLIPVILGFIWFHENAGWNKLTGIAIALVAFWLIFKKEHKLSIEKKYLILPVLLLLGNGTNDSLLKIAEGIYIKGDFIFFLSTAFFISFLLGVVIMIIQSIRKHQLPDLRSILAGIILGLLNWYSTYFFLISFRYFDVSLLVPVVNASIVVIGALSGFFIFREKMKRVNWIGILLAVCAIILMTV
jgi:drug/metabolite transporter (DMT)-like permease